MYFRIVHLNFPTRPLESLFFTDSLVSLRAILLYERAINNRVAVKRRYRDTKLARTIFKNDLPSDRSVDCGVGYQYEKETDRGDNE